MKRTIALLAISLSLANAFSLSLAFSGGVGGAFYTATEKVKTDKIVMKHRAAGVVANFFLTSPIGLGAYLRFGYLVPFYYFLSDPSATANGKADLTYTYTNMIDFAAGLSYVVKANAHIDFAFAFGYNQAVRIISPQISYIYGLTMDAAMRARLFGAMTIGLGAVLNIDFDLRMISMGMRYNKGYSLVGFIPYLSVGFFGGTEDYIYFYAKALRQDRPSLARGTPKDPLGRLRR